MILAGVDEAGYGPLLGPLVVGCAAFAIPDTSDAATDQPLPDLWKLLAKCVGKKRSAGGNRLHINDSKQVYSPASGLKELERSVLSMAAAWTAAPAHLRQLLEMLAPHVLADLPEYPWYQDRADEPFPFQQQAISVAMIANALKVELARAKIQCAHLAARVVLERQLNRMLAATRNKASVLFSTSAIHLDYLLRTYGQHNLVIFCDRQGGREHYGYLLRQMFEDWALTIVQEADGCCEYHLKQSGHTVRLLFREKAEEQCMSVALASMISKYLRETLMHRFNGFWLNHLPGLPPTAGYYTDGMRFLRDIDAKRRELGIGDADLIRAK